MTKKLTEKQQAKVKEAIALTQKMNQTLVKIETLVVELGNNK